MSRSLTTIALAALLAAAGCSSKKTSCTGGSQACGNTCVRLASDNQNCGACGNACAPGNVCANGACTFACPPGLLDCGGSCIDPQTNSDHCGASGTCTGPDAGQACAAGIGCVGGGCSLTCSGALEPCDGQCIDPQIDTRHCGGCGIVCGTGDVCLAGACTPACAAGQVRCGADCVDLLTDSTHCGACATACVAGFACELGSCQRQCALPLSRCGSGPSASCADLSFDAAHCGSCALACDAGRTCDAGACSSPACTTILGLRGAPFSASSGPALAFALADFDGDGLLDAAVLHASPPTVSILRGDGFGSFSPRSVIDVPAGSSAIAAGDLDGDAKADLVIGSSDGATATVLVLYGGGAWGFAPGAATDLATPAAPQALALADLNGDGWLDLVVGGGVAAAAQNLAIYLNNGAGHLGVAGAGPTRDPDHLYPVPADVRVIGVADLNGDFVPDLLVLSAGESTSLRANLSNNVGTGAFTSVGSQAIDPDPTGVAFGDFGSVGATDYVVSHASNQLTFFYASLGGGVDVVKRYDVLSPRAVVARDLDLDGLLDVVTADVQADALDFHRSRGISGVGGALDFDPAVFVPAGPAPIDLKLAPLSSTGPRTLVALGADGRLVAFPLVPPASGGPLGAPALHPAGNGTAAVAAGRLDAGSALDAVTADGAADELDVWLQGATTGSFGPSTAVLLPLGSAPSAVAIAPLDADANADVAVALAATGEVRIFTNDGTGALTLLRPLAVGNLPVALVAADVDGDGTVDLVTADQLSDRLTVLFQPGAATPGATLPLATGTGSGPTGLIAADLRGVGCLDLVSANAGAGTLTHFRCQPSAKGTFLAPVTIPACAGASGLAVGDLDGDGLDDLAVLCAGGGVVLQNLGGGTFGAGRSFDGGPAPASIAIADLDGDGRPDLLLANPTVGAVALVRGAPGGALSPPWLYPAGGAPRRAIVVDLAGTGERDLLVASGAQPGVLAGAGLVSIRPACLQ
jgi:hypothetical protein